MRSIFEGYLLASRVIEHTETRRHEIPMDGIILAKILRFLSTRHSCQIPLDRRSIEMPHLVRLCWLRANAGRCCFEESNHKCFSICEYCGFVARPGSWGSPATRQFFAGFGYISRCGDLLVMIVFLEQDSMNQSECRNLCLYILSHIIQSQEVMLTRRNNEVQGLDQSLQFCDVIGKFWYMKKDAFQFS